MIRHAVRAFMNVRMFVVKRNNKEIAWLFIGQKLRIKKTKQNDC